MCRVRAFVAALFWLLPAVVTSKFVGMDTKSLGDGDELKPQTLPLRLFVMRFCPYSERVLLYLSKKNLDAEIVNVKLSEKPAFLLTRNPEGRVPVLEHNGKIISDSAVICEYLDRIDPQTSILPRDSFEKARQKMLHKQLDEHIPAAVKAIVNQQRSPSQRKAATTITHNALELAENLLDSTYYGGQDAGFTDYMMYPFMERMWIWSNEPGVTDLRSSSFPSPKYPKLQRWFSNMRQRREITGVVQPLHRHRIFNQGYVKGTPDYDAGMRFPRNR